MFTRRKYIGVGCEGRLLDGNLFTRPGKAGFKIATKSRRSAHYERPRIENALQCQRVVKRPDEIIDVLKPN